MPTFLTMSMTAIRTKKKIKQTGPKKVILPTKGPGFNLAGKRTPIACLVIKSLAFHVDINEGADSSSNGVLEVGESVLLGKSLSKSASIIKLRLCSLPVSFG